jgi:hypothetical protein
MRHALRGLVGLPVLVTRFVSLLADPVAWAAHAESFLQDHGVPLLIHQDNAELTAAVRPELRRHRVEAGAGAIALSAEQAAIAQLLEDLEGAHTTFPDVELPPETPGLEQAFDETEDVIDDGRPSRLSAEWAEWIVENRRLGVTDAELAHALVEQGLDAAEARLEIRLLVNGWGEPDEPDAGADRADDADDADDADRAEDILGGPLTIPWEEIDEVLCLGSEGDVSASLFSALGKHPTVIDLTRGRLASERHAGTFDLVYHPTGCAEIEDAVALHRDVAAVLRPGGWYWVEHRNPVRAQLEGSGRWYPEGYRIASRQTRTLDTLIGTLTDEGFIVEQFAERVQGDPAAPPGHEHHLAAFVPPLLALMARLGDPR